MTSIEERRAELVEATRAELVEKIARYLPEPEVRAYYTWALSTANPERELFTRIIALTQLGNLTARILNQLPGPQDWSTVRRYTVSMNIYQIFEVISDNLAIGLGSVRPGAMSTTRNALVAFNTIMAAELRHPSKRDAAALLADLRGPCAETSTFVQSLTAGDQARMVAQYIATTGTEATERVLEHSTWSGLAANLQSGRDVLAAIAGTHGEPFMRAKLIERYEAVNRTLTCDRLSRTELVETGGQAILATPTLGYYATVFGEIDHPDHGYREALRDGTLITALDTASVLVRLLNDIGTPLLTMARQRRTELIRDLQQRNLTTDANDAVTLLTRTTDAVAFNRIHKDVINGEFNVCLYDVYRCHGLTDGLAALLDNLNFFADLYTRQRMTLAMQLIRLDRRLRDRRITEVTRRFVAFHEQLYSHRYDSLAGDYAI
ncbi:hypothetical protein [Nocardia iowensis]|uniref:Uncharacterized protein n=1 Tax=Nocardia iowensis TaxID=204891 RepID=A0ABX8RZK4_NOCIO|nr:hypothetical protein [Nocardia iowensis]QXN94691.1 hypothetical protein KV110_17525 [Nocardia iowensis]